jgi:protein kinase X
MICGFLPIKDMSQMGMFQKIVDPNHKIKFPVGVDKSAKSLIRHLLVRDVTLWYGCMMSGVEDIKKHRFFKNVNWQALADKSLEAVPFIPTLAG